MTKKYMENINTWMAYNVMKVNLECIQNGVFPNGQILQAKHRMEMEEENQNCLSLLTANGCELPTIKPLAQLQLF